MSTILISFFFMCVHVCTPSTISIIIIIIISSRPYSTLGYEYVTTFSLAYTCLLIQCRIWKWCVCVCVLQGLCWVSLVWLKLWFNSCWPTSSSTWRFSAFVQSQRTVPLRAAVPTVCFYAVCRPDNETTLCLKKLNPLLHVRISPTNVAECQ